jgi:hypothetical protein
LLQLQAMCICYPMSMIYDMTMIALVSYINILIEWMYPVYPDSILKVVSMQGTLFLFTVAIYDHILCSIASLMICRSAKYSLIHETPSPNSKNSQNKLGGQRL